MTKENYGKSLSADEMFDICMAKYQGQIEANATLYRRPSKVTYKAGDKVMCLSGIDERTGGIKEYETKIITVESVSLYGGAKCDGVSVGSSYWILSENGSMCQTQDVMLRPAEEL
jgi:hypothetical protein